MQVSALLGKGYDVVVPSLCGFGEVGNGYKSGYGDGTFAMYLAMMQVHCANSEFSHGYLIPLTTAVDTTPTEPKCGGATCS